MIGKTLAHYEILDKIGAGGMGEVYRARDTKLGRDVALKLLPQVFTDDPERLARFDREARTLASLNHPNIAAIYGIEEAAQQRFLVMELVAGDDLSDRLRRGPLPLGEALAFARQLADGLEQAHEQGIVHRDLKPANVKITPEGRLKILDFGLARAYMGQTVDEGSPEHSPTITAAMTQQGVILGTAAYMSPEQAKGKPVDRRADLWAFGVILWEMLTGKRLFQGDDMSDTLAAVLRAEPPWGDLPGETPQAVRRLLQRCLERDPRKRLRDIGEARVRLERWTDDPSTLVDVSQVRFAAAKSTPWRQRLPWVGALVLLVAFAVWGWLPQGPGRGATAPRMALEMRLPAENGVHVGGGTNIQISPDGNLLAYLNDDGIRLRRFDQRDARLLSGTAGATLFTFSPDGQWIAFTVPGKLLRVSVTGGAPIEICEAQDSRGVAWMDESTLVFTPTFVNSLHVVSLQDGIPHPLTTLDSARSERSHRWPFRLPDGKSVLYLCQFSDQQYDEGEIRICSLADGTSKTVYRGGSSPRYTASGHLLFAKDQTVFAVPLDLGKREVRGLAVPVVSGILALVNDQESDDGSAQFDVSLGGLLVYRTAITGTNRRLGRLDLRSGVFEPWSDPADYANPVLSPDGRTLAVEKGEGNQKDIYLVDVETRIETRFTLERGADQMGCWSHDSRMLYWMRRIPGEGVYVLLRRPADGSGPEEEIERRTNNFAPNAASSDGKWLMLTVWNVADQWDVVLVPTARSDAQPRLFAGGPQNQLWPLFSPDGRWVSYISDETGEWALYVHRFPDTGARWRITGGFVTASVTWASDGNAIFLRDDTSIRRIPLQRSEASLAAGRPEVLMTEDYYRGFSDFGAALSPDGSYAYVSQQERQAREQQDPSRIVLVTDWLAELEQLVSAGR